MRKSTKAILIALAVLIAPAIYVGYLLYRESKIIDVVSITVKETVTNQGVSQLLVFLKRLKPENDDGYIRSYTDKNGVAKFYNLRPGTYYVGYLIKPVNSDYKEECGFQFTAQGIKVFIEIYIDSCDSSKQILFIKK